MKVFSTMFTAVLAIAGLDLSSAAAATPPGLAVCGPLQAIAGKQIQYYYQLTTKKCFSAVAPVNSKSVYTETGATACSDPTTGCGRDAVLFPPVQQQPVVKKPLTTQERADQRKAKADEANLNGGPGSREIVDQGGLALGNVKLLPGTAIGYGSLANKDGTSVPFVALTKPTTIDGKTYPAGTRLDQNTGLEVHSPGTEYLSSADSPGGPRVYHSLEDAQAAGIMTDPNTVVTKYDRDGNAIPGTGKKISEIEDGIKADRTAENEKREKEGKPKKFDDCQKSYDYALKYDPQNADRYKCSTTNGIAKGTEIANQVLTGTGRSVVNQMGANAAQAARNGTLIGDQKAAAQMAKTSATYETALTVANTAAAVILGKKANQHKQNLATLADAEADAKKRVAAGIGDVDSSTIERAHQEQANARDVASVAAFKATMTALQGAAGMVAAKSAQKAAETNARLAQQAQDQIQANAFKYDPNQLAPPISNAYDPNQMAATSGTTDASATTSSDGSTTGLDNVKLGDGTDSGAGSDSINAPNAAAFKSGVAGSAGGGAAGGGAPSAGAGGSGSGGPTAAEDPKAAYASEFGTKERYETSGGITGAGGAKGAVGGKGADGSGVDLNGLLAQFLPKSEDDSAHRSILDSVAFGGNRNIANEEAPSYLDKNADLFQRIHETMSEKNRRGQLGI